MALGGIGTRIKNKVVRWKNWLSKSPMEVRLISSQSACLLGAYSFTYVTNVYHTFIELTCTDITPVLLEFTA
jgi:hypothetical protein